MLWNTRLSIFLTSILTSILTICPSKKDTLSMWLRTGSRKGLSTKLSKDKLCTPPLNNRSSKKSYNNQSSNNRCSTNPSPPLKSSRPLKPKPKSLNKGTCNIQKQPLPLNSMGILRGCLSKCNTNSTLHKPPQQLLSSMDMPSQDSNRDSLQANQFITAS